MPTSTVYAECSGDSIQNDGTTLSCLSGGTASTWSSVTLQAPAPAAFDISNLSPSDVASYFGAGFGLVGSCLMLGVAVRLLYRAFRR